MRNAGSRVTIVVLTHNRAARLRETLRRLRALHEYPQIIVADNASTDETVPMVEHTFPDVRIVQCGRNIGAAGRNRAVAYVDTEYVAFCDDDTWWEPGALTHAADLFDAAPRLAIATARVLIGPEQREDPACQLMARSPLPRAQGMPGAPLLGFLAGASVVRRSAFLSVGGFAPRFFLGGEEQLLASDLAAAGWWLCYVPELIVHHYPSQRRDVASRRGYLVRNGLWFAWMRRPLRGALRRTLAAALAATRDQAALHGFASALAGLPWALSQRRVVPPEIEHGLRQIELRGQY